MDGFREGKSYKVNGKAFFHNKGTLFWVSDDGTKRFTVRQMPERGDLM